LDGIVHGDLTVNSGQVGLAGRFDGNDYVEIPSSPRIRNGIWSKPVSDNRGLH